MTGAAVVKRKTAAAACAAALCAGVLCLPASTAEARIAFPHRNDLFEIESAEITVLTQLQIYYKYVLTSLDGLKSITNLDSLVENTGILREAEEEAGWLKTVGAEAERAAAGGLERVEEAFADSGSATGDAFSSIWNAIFGGNTKGDSVADVIETGGGTSAGIELTGEKGSLAQIARSKGPAAAASAAALRTSEAAAVIAGQAAENASGGGEKATAEAAVWLYSALPMINETLLEANSGEIADSIAAYGSEDVAAYRTFLADASATPATARIASMLDKYFNSGSPYSDENIKKQTSDLIQKVDEGAGALDGASAQTAAAAYMGTLVLEQKAAMEQLENLTEIAADAVKLNGLKAGTAAAASSLNAVENVVRAAAAYRAWDGVRELEEAE